MKRTENHSAEVLELLRLQPGQVFELAGTESSYYLTDELELFVRLVGTGYWKPCTWVDVVHLLTGALPITKRTGEYVGC